MARAKSIFITTYATVAMGIMTYAAWMTYQGLDRMAWSGALLTTAPLLLMLGWLMAFRSVPRTSARLPLVHALAAGGTVLATWGWYSRGAPLSALGAAAAGWSGVLAYACWYSALGRRPSPRLTVGSRLPHFAVINVRGERITSEDLTNRPAILIFFRGDWCPLCVAQIGEMASRYRELEALGVRVALISPQPHDNTRALADKHGVPFDFLTDVGNATARELGIAHPHGVPFGMEALGYDSETVLPTVVITNASGTVIWTHETDNYRVRPEPDTFLRVLRKHGVTSARPEAGIDAWREQRASS